MFKLFCTFLVLLLASTSNAAEFTLEKSIKVPALAGVNFRQFTFNNSRGSIAYRPETGTFLMRGHPSFPDWAELDISGATAVVKGWSDPTHGMAAAETAKVPGSQGFYLRSMCITDQDETLLCISEFYNVGQVNRCPFARGDLSLGGPAVGPWNGGQHSLQLGGYLSPLSPELRRHFRCRWAGGETSSQGTASSNRGPSLYVFDQPERSFIPNGVFSSRPVITHVGTNAYPGWYPSWKINSMHGLPDRVIWIGRKGTGANWYGGQIDTATGAKDIVYADKGYHSETYVPCVWECSNVSIIAGAPVITETTLSGMTTGKGSDITSAWDGKRLYVVDPKSDADRPVIRSFEVR